MLAQMMEMEDDFEERLFEVEEEWFAKTREQNRLIKIAKEEAKEEAKEKATEQIAEILYIRDMEFDGWEEKDILPFKELKREFKNNFLKLAKNLYKVAIND